MSSVVDSSARTPSAADRRYAHVGGAPYAARDGHRLSRLKKALIALAALAVLLVVIVPPSVTLTRKHDEEGTLAQAAEIGYTTVIAGTSTFIQTRTASIVTRSAVSTNTDGRVSTFIERVTLPVVTVSATALESAVQPHFKTVTVNGEVIIEATSTSFIPAAGAAVVTRTDLAAHEVVATVVQTSYADVTIKHANFYSTGEHDHECSRCFDNDELDHNVHDFNQSIRDYYYFDPHYVGHGILIDNLLSFFHVADGGTDFNNRQSLHSRPAARTWRLPSLDDHHRRDDHNTCPDYDNIDTPTAVYSGPAGQTRRLSHNDNHNAGSLHDDDFRAHTDDYDAF
ncbi:hypothetical protein RHOSPDRAFT_24864 [Rhodotorula sp. JG-1b]|nr:hypothetical protein RHOSPDRAFT_24864 [Rhodotorula sp. JG-1b]